MRYARVVSLVTVVCVSSLGLLLVAPSAEAAPLLQTTSTPTPTPTPGPNNQPVSSFHVDTQQEPPWAVPIFATWGTGTPQPTLYAATPDHATGYPNTLASATAQISLFTGPINNISTPAAGIIGAGPTQTGGDVDTGIDVTGGGNITLLGFGSSMHDNLVGMIGGAKVFVLDLIDLAVYIPWMAAIPPLILITVVVSVFVDIIALIMAVGRWLFEVATKVLITIGVLKPG